MGIGEKDRKGVLGRNTGYILFRNQNSLKEGASVFETGAQPFYTCRGFSCPWQHDQEAQPTE